VDRSSRVLARAYLTANREEEKLVEVEAGNRGRPTHSSGGKTEETENLTG